MRRFRNTKELRMQFRTVPQGSVATERPNGIAYAYECANGDRVTFYAIAYRGTAGKPSFHYRYSRQDQRDNAIAEFIASLDRVAVYKAEQNAERKARRNQEPGKDGRYSLTETAELVRQALRAAFPQTAFSVRSKSYSGGSSIDVAWTDGPIQSQVTPLLEPFQGADFDGMQDLKTYRDASEYQGKRVTFGVDYVHSQRHESPELIQAANERVARECGLPLLTMKMSGRYGHFEDGENRVDWVYRPCGLIRDTGVGEWHSQLVYQVARNTSLEERVTVKELPQAVTTEYIDDVVRRMLEGVTP